MFFPYYKMTISFLTTPQTTCYILLLNIKMFRGNLSHLKELAKCTVFESLIRTKNFVIHITVLNNNNIPKGTFAVTQNFNLRIP